MIHVTIQQLSSYLDGQLAGASEDLVRQHVAACPDCASRLEAMSRVDEALFRTLAADPDPSVLDRLIEEVGSSIGAGKRREAPKGFSAGVPAEVPSEERPADTISPAPRPSGVAPRPTPRPTQPARNAPPSRSARAATGPSAPRPGSSPATSWLVVFILALIAGSAGIVVARSDWAKSWMDVIDGSLAGRPGLAGAPEPPASAPAVTDPETPMPNSTDGSPAAALLPSTPPPALPAGNDDEIEAEPSVPPPPDETAEPNTMRADESLPAPAAAKAASDGPDPFASLRSDLRAPLRAAERLSNEAAIEPTAAKYDAAARAWERAIEGMGGLPEQVVARGRLADARYRAWVASPDATHEQQAEDALRSYLLFAPGGALREEAKARLERLR